MIRNDWSKWVQFQSAHTAVNMLAKSRWSQLLKCLYKQPWVFAFLPCLIAFLVKTNTLAAPSLWPSWLLSSTSSLMYHHHHQVQTTTLAKEMLDPTQTVVNTRRLNLSHFDVFPVVFKLCIQPGFNQTAVVEAGYSEVGWMESKTNVNILTPIHELAKKTWYTYTVTRVVPHVHKMVIFQISI